MEINPSQFHLLNVTDTCAVWNILSSRLLYRTAVSVGCHFSCTTFVNYECLLKPRKATSPAEEELKNRLRTEQQNGQFRVCELTTDDLLEMDILESRKKLGKGELSSIAFAKRTPQAFQTDDKSARKLAQQVMQEKLVQTTPHLFGWLYFTQRLGDSDKEAIIEEHERHQRPLRNQFEEMYLRALQYRVRSRGLQHSKAET